MKKQNKKKAKKAHITQHHPIYASLMQSCVRIQKRGLRTEIKQQLPCVRLDNVLRKIVHELIIRHRDI